MTTRLYGAELIDCARANGNYGIEVAAERCGYKSDLDRFETELKKACDNIGVEFHQFSDLLAPATNATTKDIGIVVAPDTPSQL